MKSNKTAMHINQRNGERYSAVHNQFPHTKTTIINERASQFTATIRSV